MVQQSMLRSWNLYAIWQRLQLHAPYCVVYWCRIQLSPTLLHIPNNQLVLTLPLLVDVHFFVSFTTRMHLDEGKFQLLLTTTPCCSPCRSWMPDPATACCVAPCLALKNSVFFCNKRILLVTVWDSMSKFSFTPSVSQTANLVNFFSLGL